MADTMNRTLQDGYDSLLRTGREIEQSGREIQEQVHKARGIRVLHREPTATLELTEDELQAALDRLDSPQNREELTLRGKLSQALAVELGSGGAFHESYDGGDAA